MDRTLQHKLSKKHHTISLLLIVVLTIIVLFLILRTNFLLASVSERINPDIYQIIHLDNGETYFGKVIDVDNAFVSLAEAYRIQSDGDSKLIKSNSKDPKLLNRDHVLSIEKLKRDSPILQAIEKYEQ
jgi:hypothetical protein